MRYLGPDTGAKGYVGEDAYGALLSSLAPPDATETRVALLHHHIQPVGRNEVISGRSALTMADGGELAEELQVAGFRLVLHGHGHEDSVQPGGRLGRDGSGLERGHLEPLWVAGCGSSGARLERLDGRSRRNCAMVYDLTSTRQIRGECLKYTTEAPPAISYLFDLPLFGWGRMHYSPEHVP
jgi:hypothetical protein